MNNTFLYISNDNETFYKYIVSDNTIFDIDLYSEFNQFIELENNSVFFYYLKNVLVLNNKNTYVEVSENNLEIVLKFENKIDEIYKLIKDGILFSPFYLNNSEINNVFKYDEFSLLFVLDNPIEADDNLMIFKEINRTDVHTMVYEEQDAVKPDLIIKNHRKDNLQNYKERGATVSRRKTYGDVKGDRFETIGSNNSLFDSEINIDFSNFNTFTKYGSALSKIVNLEGKIEKIKNLNFLIDNELNPTKNKQDKINILESMTPYERWAYTHKFLKLSENEFNIWLSSKKEDAVDFDGKNNELLLYQLPRYIVDNDEYGYLTNFVFLMGDFFDNLYMYEESLSYINEYSINEKNKVPTFAIEDIFDQMGFSFDINFSNEEFKKYFQDEDNVNKVSNMLSHRLIDSIPQLAKMKGTVKSIEYLLNIFGIPKGIYNVVEFSKEENDNEFNEFINEDEEWFMTIPDDEQVHIGMTESDMDINLFTFEFVVKNLQSSGVLMRMNSQNYLEYSFDGENLLISLTLNNEEVYSHIFTITDYNEAWTFITIKRNSKKIFVRVAQKIQNVDKILNDNFYTKDASITSPITFFNLSLGGGVHITEFRLFDSFLDKMSTDIHINDIRSVNELNESTLNTRLLFYRPIGNLSNFKSIDGNEYDISFTSNISLENFNKYTFRNVLLSNTIFSNDIYSDKIRIIETEFVDNLEVLDNPYIFFDNDSNVIQDRTLSSKIRKNVFNDQYEDQPIIGIYLSENDLINKKVLRKKGIVNTINPEWFGENRYSFNNFKNIKPIQYNDLTPSIKKMYGLFNDKIFDIIKEFIPARSTLKNGVLVKNNILNKNKDVYESKMAKSLEYEISPIDLRKGMFGDEEYLKYEIELDKSKSDVTFENKIFQNRKTINIVLKTDRSQYLKPIETYETNWKSPFLRRIIRGKTESSELLTAEQLREFLNFGAQILVL